MTASTTPASDVAIDAATRERIIETISSRFHCTITGPDDVGYEHARKLWNAMIDKRPGLILWCTRTADVVTAVGVAREFGLAPAVRGGGHNGALDDDRASG
jgi:FAD/FMN-containing dehydrogenase